MIITELMVQLINREPETKAETVSIEDVFELTTGYEVRAGLIVELEGEMFCEFEILLFLEEVNDGHDEICDKLINPNSRIRNLIKTICSILYNNRF